MDDDNDDLDDDENDDEEEEEGRKEGKRLVVSDTCSRTRGTIPSPRVRE